MIILFYLSLSLTLWSDNDNFARHGDMSTCVNSVGSQLTNHVKQNTSMNKITKAGGEVIGEPMDIPGFGMYVSFYDTEGNRVSIMEPTMEMKEKWESFGLFQKNIKPLNVALIYLKL